MTTPSDFPWRPGMRIRPNAAGGNRYARILTVDDGVPTCIAVEMPVGLSRDVGPWIEAWNEHAENDQDEPDLTDPATIGALLGAVREAYGEPTLHPRPVLLDTLTNTGPQVVWYIERAKEDDHEWLRTNGMWGEMVDGHKAPAISTATEADALLAAWAARPVRS